MTDAARAIKPLFPVAQIHALDTHFAVHDVYPFGDVE
jgi:hypothetical protein